MLSSKLHASIQNKASIHERIARSCKLLFAVTHRERYGCLLRSLYIIYSEMEAYLWKTREDPKLCGIYKVLQPCFRTKAIEKDLGFYIDNDWRNDLAEKTASDIYIRQIKQLQSDVRFQSLLISYCYWLYVSMFTHTPTKVNLLKRFLSCPGDLGLAFFQFQDSSRLLLQHRILDHLDHMTLDKETEQLIIFENSNVIRLENEILQNLNLPLYLPSFWITRTLLAIFAMFATYNFCRIVSVFTSLQLLEQ